MDYNENLQSDPLPDDSIELLAVVPEEDTLLSGGVICGSTGQLRYSRPIQEHLVPDPSPFFPIDVNLDQITWWMDKKGKLRP